MKVHFFRVTLPCCEVADGLSQVMRHVATTFSAGLNSLSTGVRFHGTNRLLRAKLGLIISDEAALNRMFSSKGASGSKPCMMCRNVVLHSSELWKFNERLRSIAEEDPASFRLHTDETLFQCCDRLRRLELYVG